VYLQAAMAANLGITNAKMLPELMVFKHTFKVATQNNRLGVAEKARVRKMLVQDYKMDKLFFDEIDASLKKNCKTLQHIQSYFTHFQGFVSDLFNFLQLLMQWKFRLAMLINRLLYRQTAKMVHNILTQQEWDEPSSQKAAWSVRKYAASLGFSEQWIVDFVYHVVILAREDSKRQAKQNKKG
jgi:hypothetical protein